MRNYIPALDSLHFTAVFRPPKYKFTTLQLLIVFFLGGGGCISVPDNVYHVWFYWIYRESAQISAYSYENNIEMEVPRTGTPFPQIPVAGNL